MGVNISAIHNEGHPTPVGIRCMGAVRFESTDLDASEAFYTQSMGLEKLFRGMGPLGREEFIGRFPSGQLVIIESVDTPNIRSGGHRWTGHHTAAHIEPWDYKAVNERIVAHQHLASEITHGERYDREVEAVYVHDPSTANRWQISSYDADTTRELPAKSEDQHGAQIRETGMSPRERRDLQMREVAG